MLKVSHVSNNDDDLGTYAYVGSNGVVKERTDKDTPSKVSSQSAISEVQVCLIVLICLVIQNISS